MTGAESAGFGRAEFGVREFGKLDRSAERHDPWPAEESFDETRLVPQNFVDLLRAPGAPIRHYWRRDARSLR